MNRKKEKELSSIQSGPFGNPRLNGPAGAASPHAYKSMSSHKTVDGRMSIKNPGLPLHVAGPGNQTFGEASSLSAKPQGSSRKERMTVVLGGDGAREVDLGSRRGQEAGKAKSKADKKGRQNQGQPIDRKSSHEKTSHTKSFKGTLANKDVESVLRMLASHRIFELKKRNLSFPNARFFCRLCEYHLDTIEDCEKHLGENRHQRKKEAADSEGILQHIPDPTNDQLRALDSVLEKVVTERGLSSQELQDRQNIVDRLQKFISQFKDGVMLQLYGSSRSGVGLKESDVNVELSGNEPAPKLLLDVFNILCKEQGKEFTNVHNDFLAKVPVVNLIDMATGLKVVLGINGQTAILTSNLLHLYSLADPRMRKIAVILRCWANLCHLDRQEEGTLPPFALSIMTVYFLQQVTPPVLCVFKDPKEAPQQSPKIPKVDPAKVFSEFQEQAQRWVSSNKMCVGELWLRLLRFYCLEFDSIHHVVSIRQEKPLPRSEKKWHSKRLAIEDPCLPKKNVANSMANTLIYEYFQGSLRKAYYYFGLPRNASGESLVSVDLLKDLACQRTAQLLKEHQEGDEKDAASTSSKVERDTSQVKSSSQKETKKDGPLLDDGKGVNVNADDDRGKRVNTNADDVTRKEVNVNTDDAKLNVSYDSAGNIEDQSRTASADLSQFLTKRLKYVDEFDMINDTTCVKDAANPPQQETVIDTCPKDVVPDKSAGHCSSESRAKDRSHEEETRSTPATEEVSEVKANSSCAEENESHVAGMDRTTETKPESTCMVETVQEVSKSPQVTIPASISVVTVLYPTASAALGCCSSLQTETMCSSQKQKSLFIDQQVEEAQRDADLKGLGGTGDQTQEVTSKVCAGDVSGDQTQVVSTKECAGDISDDQKREVTAKISTGDVSGDQTEEMTIKVCAGDISENADSDKSGCQGERITREPGTKKAHDGHILEECLRSMSLNRSQDLNVVSLEVTKAAAVIDYELSEGSSANARRNKDYSANNQPQKVGTELNTRQVEQNLESIEKTIKASAFEESLRPRDKTPDVDEQKLRNFARDYAEFIVVNAYHVLQETQDNDKLEGPVETGEAACVYTSRREAAEDRRCPMPSCSPEHHQESTETVASSQASTAAEVIGCFYKFTEDVFTDGKGPAVICSYCEQEGHLKGSCPEDKLPEVTPLPAMTTNHMALLNNVIDRIMHLYGLNQSNFFKRKSLAMELEGFVRQVYPDATFSLFGSSCNGFGFQSSDLDICMTLEGKTVEDLDVAETIENVAKRLKQRRGLYNIVPIPTAKVPIVKFTDNRTELEGDISLYNILAQRNTKLLQHYTMIDPRVRPLGYAIKVFAKECDIGDASRGSLSSYGYILMMLHFLQQCSPPVIPVLQELHPEGQHPEVIVEGWNTWFFDDFANLAKVWKGYGKNKKNPGDLWLGFFRYYLEDFDWKGRVVTIRQKAPLTKFEKLWNGRSIAVEDPFDLNHNLGSGLSRKMNNYIYKTFVNGRILFGTPHEMNMQIFLQHRSPIDYFFDYHLLCDGKPPNDRGCRLCGKIGHVVKDCPNRRPKKQSKGQDERGAGDKQKGQAQEQSKDSSQTKQSKQMASNKAATSEAEGRKHLKKGKPESAANNSSALTATAVISTIVTNSSNGHHRSLGHLSPSQEGHMSSPSPQRHISSPSQQSPGSSQAGPPGVQSPAATMPTQGTDGSQALERIPTGSHPPGIPVDVQQLFSMCGGSETSLIPRMTDAVPTPGVNQLSPMLINLTPEQQINILTRSPGSVGDMRIRDKESPGRGPQICPPPQISPAKRLQEEDIVQLLPPMQFSSLLTQQAGQQPQTNQLPQMAQQSHHQFAAQQQQPRQQQPRQQQPRQQQPRQQQPRQQQHLVQQFHHQFPQQQTLSQQQQLHNFQQQQAFLTAQQQQHPPTQPQNHAAHQQQQQHHMQLSPAQQQQPRPHLAQRPYFQGQHPMVSPPHNQQPAGSESHHAQGLRLQQAAHPEFSFQQPVRQPPFLVRMTPSAASTPSPPPPTAPPASRQALTYISVQSASPMGAASRPPFVMPAVMAGSPCMWVQGPALLQSQQNQQDHGSDSCAIPNHHPGSS